MRLFAEACVVGLMLGVSVVSRGATPTPPVPPRAAVARDWTDATGRFHTKGILLGGDRSQVRLQKVPGSAITVSMSKLSAKDQQFVRDALGLSDRKGAERTAPSTAAPNAALSSKEGKHGGASSGRLNGASKNWSGIGIPLPDATAMAMAQGLLSAPAAPMPENMIYVRLSKPFLERISATDISESGPVNDVILGSPVTGTSKTVGVAHVELQPSETEGLAEIHLFGSTTYDAVADGGPVRIFEHGITGFASSKALRVDGQGIAIGPAATNAKTWSVITGVATSLPRLRGRIALRVGSRRAEESREEAAEVTSQHTAAQINHEFDVAASAQVADLYKSIREQLADLPSDHMLRQCCWRASTTKDAMEIVVLASPSKKYNPTTTPTALADSDAEVHIHVALVRFAMADEGMQRVMRRVMQAIESPQASTATPPVGQPALAWSKDRTWLTLRWPTSAVSPQASPKASPELASRAH